MDLSTDRPERDARAILLVPYGIAMMIDATVTFHLHSSDMTVSSTNLAGIVCIVDTLLLPAQAVHVAHSGTARIRLNRYHL